MTCTKLDRRSQREAKPYFQMLLYHTLRSVLPMQLYQNKDNEKGLKQSLEAIVPHAFGDHAKCSLEWCGRLKNPAGYKHVGLPDGKDLHCAALKKCLTDVIQKYATPDMLKKIAPLSSSQKNETANSVIGTKSLKIRYYRGSESNDYRIAAGVAQVNEGKTVGVNLLINVNGKWNAVKLGENWRIISSVSCC